MRYLYESHLGNLYISDNYIDDDELYCEECGDSDWLIGQFDNIEDFWNLIEDQVDICGSGGYKLKYIYPFIVGEFELDDKLDFDEDWPHYCTWDDERIIGRIEELIGRKIPLLLSERISIFNRGNV